MSISIFICISKYTKYYEITENVGQSSLDFSKQDKNETYNIVLKKNHTLIQYAQRRFGVTSFGLL